MMLVFAGVPMVAQRLGVLLLPWQLCHTGRKEKMWSLPTDGQHTPKVQDPSALQQSPNIACPSAPVVQVDQVPQASPASGTRGAMHLVHSGGWTAHTLAHRVHCHRQTAPQSWRASGQRPLCCQGWKHNHGCDRTASSLQDSRLVSQARDDKRKCMFPSGQPQ